MPLGAQPPGREGDYDRPYSALNLRLILALFGLVVCTLGTVLLARAGHTGPAWATGILAAVAAVDIVVIQLRRRARGRGGAGRRSPFE